MQTESRLEPTEPKNVDTLAVWGLRYRRPPRLGSGIAESDDMPCRGTQRPAVSTQQVAKHEILRGAGGVDE